MWPALADERPVATHTRSPSKAGCTTRTFGWDPLAVARYAQVAFAAVAWTLSQKFESLIEVPPKESRNTIMDVSVVYLVRRDGLDMTKKGDLAGVAKDAGNLTPNP